MLTKVLMVVIVLYLRSGFASGDCGEPWETKLFYTGFPFSSCAPRIQVVVEVGGRAKRKTRPYMHHDNAIDEMWIGGGRVVCQSLIELHQLIYSFISHQSFSNKQH
ncbi:hypothetical protein B566_EDAN001370 [Ephemera danica]|nr:hypothetical protein B566_EDAN001370 [Ephemera danica]